MIINVLTTQYSVWIICQRDSRLALTRYECIIMSFEFWLLWTTMTSTMTTTSAVLFDRTSRSFRDRYLIRHDFFVSYSTAEPAKRRWGQTNFVTPNPPFLARLHAAASQVQNVAAGSMGSIAPFAPPHQTRHSWFGL